MQRRIAMKKVIVSMLAVGAFIFLTGCEEKPKTRDYYKQHVEEAKVKVQECAKKERISKNEQEDCSNAKFVTEAGTNTWEGKSDPNALKYE